MKRRQFLKFAAVPLVGRLDVRRGRRSSPRQRTFARVRPGDPAWPTDGMWDQLKQGVGGRLIKLESPLATCQSAPVESSCADVLKELKNPYYIGDQPALTQASGWLNAWTSRPSAYAVTAESTADVVAAVNFARKHRLRLVVKGGGHSYQGTSSAPDSLLVWTRKMNQVALLDTFVPRGCEGTLKPQPAVSVGACAIWMPVYNEVITHGGRYVQGGGCATVGVAGLVQSGGFGSFSKRYGLAAAELLEAEVVTADGAVHVVNACSEPDLFWGLRGGGGGSLGVVTRLTLRTRELPEFFGGAFGTIKANSDEAFRRLVARLIAFYQERLFNPDWGEQIRFHGRNAVDIQMVFQGLTQAQAEETWRPIREWVSSAPGDCTWQRPLVLAAIPARSFWDPAFLRKNLPQFVVADDRPDAPEGNILWAGDADQAGMYLHGYHSAWLPASLLEKSRQMVLVDALIAACRQWEVSLHFNKGLAGSPVDDREAAKETATNSAVVDAFALAIVAGAGPAAYPGMPGSFPDRVSGRMHAQAIDRAMAALSPLVPQPASYVSESDFFEPKWQQAFWGANYARLAAVKKKYDPDGLFYVHHGVGSEEWSQDGFTRLGV